MKTTPVDLGAIFVGHGLPRPEAEVLFAPGRKLAWDFCWPEYRIAIERQGSTWTAGKHTRGQGYRDDCFKSVEGQLRGWVVIFLTADMLADGSAFALVRRALEARGWKGDE